MECPSCALEAPDDAETCPYCNYEFPRQKRSVMVMAIVMAMLLAWPIFKLIQLLTG